MRTSSALLLIVSLISFGDWHLRGQEKRPEEPASRYRLVQVVEASTLQDRINEAAREGYRLAGVIPAAGATTVAVLEKTDGLSDAYSYLFLSGKGDAALQERLNDAGARGFRIVSRDIALDWRTPVSFQLRSVLVWMEKAPGPERKFEYVLVPFGAKMTLKAGLNPKLWADMNPLDYVRPEISRAEERGFRLVRIISPVALIMEKTASLENDAGAQATAARAGKQPPPYRSLTSLKGSKLQRRLQEEAASGYCLVDIDPEAPPVWPSTLLDKGGVAWTGAPHNPCTYEVIRKRDLGEEDFNQAGTRGFHLVAQSMNFYGAFQTSANSASAYERRQQPEVEAIFEKSPETNQIYSYRSLSASRLSDLSDDLEQAAADGYRVIKVDGVKDGAILVIMEKVEQVGSK